MNIHIEKRQSGAPGTVVAVLISVAAMLAVLALIFAYMGANPFQALWLMISGGFESSYTLSEVLVKATPLIFTGLATACGLKMKLWNIGAEGQMYMGAVGAVFAAQTFQNLPAFLLIPLMILMGAMMGAATGGVAGFLKKQLNVSEILTTLMLNYIVISLVNYLIYGPWRDPQSYGFPVTARFVPAAWFPQFGGTRLHLGFFLALVTAVVIYFLIEKTSWGFEIRATGASLGGAQYAGISVGRNIILVFLLCGALAGMAGVCEVAGLHHKLQPGNISANYGNLGIIVAWLSNAHPLAIVVTAVLAGALLVGADGLQVSTGISSDVVQIIIGILMIGILCIKFFKEHRIVFCRTAEKGETV